MAEPYGFVVRTDGATELRSALAQNEAELVILTQEAHGVPVAEFDIVRVSVLSAENLAWDVYFYDSEPGALTEHDDNPVVDWIEFAVAQGKQINATGPFIYSLSSFKTRFVNRNGEPTIYVRLCQRDAAGKTANDPGKVVVIIEGTSTGKDYPAQTPETYP